MLPFPYFRSYIKEFKLKEELWQYGYDSLSNFIFLLSRLSSLFIDVIKLETSVAGPSVHCSARRKTCVKHQALHYYYIYDQRFGETMSNGSCLQIRLNRIFAKCWRIRVFLPYWVNTGYKTLIQKRTVFQYKSSSNTFYKSINTFLYFCS